VSCEESSKWTGVLLLPVSSCPLALKFVLRILDFAFKTWCEFLQSHFNENEMQQQTFEAQ
jgi:hypothetical protein